MTVYELTHQSLYELTKDLPAEAFPADRYGRVRYDPKAETWFDANNAPLEQPPEALAQRFIASCLLWLTKTASMVHVGAVCFNAPPPQMRVSTSRSSGGELRSSPTLLEAIVDRVKQERLATMLPPKI